MRRACHFSLRRGSLLPSGSGMGSDGTRAHAHQRPCHCGALLASAEALRSHPPARAARPTAPSRFAQRVVAFVRRQDDTPAGTPAAEPPGRSARGAECLVPAAPGSTSRLTSRGRKRRPSISSPVRMASIAGPDRSRGTRTVPRRRRSGCAEPPASPNAVGTSPRRRPPRGRSPDHPRSPGRRRRRIGLLRSRYTNPADPRPARCRASLRTGLSDDLEVGTRTEDRVLLIPRCRRRTDPDLGIVLQPVHGRLETERHLRLTALARLRGG